MGSADSIHRVTVIGCGHVGTALACSLSRAGHSVIGTTTTPARVDDLRRLGLRAEKVNVSDTDRLRAVCRDRDTIYLTVAPKQRDEDYRDVYLAAVTNLLTAVRGTRAGNIIYTSSTRVYGQDDGGWVDECSPIEPTGAKGRILMETEQRLLEGAAELGVSATVVRLCGIYGPGRDVTGTVGRSSGTERDDGDKYINMIHIDDIVTTLAAFLDIRRHGAFNLSDDRPTSRRDFFDRVLMESGLPPIQWRKPAKPHLGKRIRNDLIKKTLHLTLKHPTH